MKAKMLITAAALAIATTFTGCVDDETEDLINALNNIENDITYEVSGEWTGEYSEDGQTAYTEMYLDWSDDTYRFSSFDGDDSFADTAYAETGTWTTSANKVTITNSDNEVSVFDYITGDVADTLKSDDGTVVLTQDNI